MKKLLIALTLICFSHTTYAANGTLVAGGGLLAAYGAYRIAITNSATNATFAEKMKAPCATSGAACVMMGMGIVGMAAGLMAAGESKKTIDALDCNTNGTCTNGGTGSDGSGSTIPPGRLAQVNEQLPGLNNQLDRLQGQYNDLKKNLDARGYSVNPDGTVTTPSGAKISAAQAGVNGAGIPGVSPADLKNIADAMAETAKQAERFKVTEEDEEYGGGGAGGAAGGGYAAGARAGSAGFRTPSSANSQPSTAGLQKNYGDSKIGVSGDDIFKMISTRYRITQPSLTGE